MHKIFYNVRVCFWQFIMVHFLADKKKSVRREIEDLWKKAFSNNLQRNIVVPLSPLLAIILSNCLQSVIVIIFLRHFFSYSGCDDETVVHSRTKIVFRKWIKHEGGKNRWQKLEYNNFNPAKMVGNFFFSPITVHYILIRAWHRSKLLATVVVERIYKN